MQDQCIAEAVWAGAQYMPRLATHRRVIDNTSIKTEVSIGCSVLSK